MKYRLLIMDVDNTLLCTDKSLSEKNRKAILSLKDSDVMVSLASGRPSIDIYSFAQMVGIEENWGVSDNGAGVFHGKDRAIIKFFNRDYFDYLIDELERNGIERGVFSGGTPDFIYTEDSPLLGREMLKYLPVTKERIGDIRDVEKPYKVCAWFKNDRERKIIESLQVEGEMSGVVPDPGLYDLMPYNVTKIIGTRELVKRLGITMDEVIAVGDQQNDQTMIEGAGLGIAVANAVDVVKEAADVVLKQSCNDDAIAYVIEKYILED